MLEWILHSGMAWYGLICSNCRHGILNSRSPIKLCSTPSHSQPVSAISVCTACLQLATAIVKLTQVDDLPEQKNWNQVAYVKGLTKVANGHEQVSSKGHAGCCAA